MSKHWLLSMIELNRSSRADLTVRDPPHPWTWRDTVILGFFLLGAGVFVMGILAVLCW